jgi:hypothetical protein
MAVQELPEQTEISRRIFIYGVRPQLACPCQRYPPLDIGRINCEKYAIVFISIPVNIKVALTVCYGHQVAYSFFVVLQFSCRSRDIPPASSADEREGGKPAQLPGSILTTLADNQQN